MKVKSKLYVVYWLVLHGFIPKKYFWVKKLKLLKTSHKFFDYDKFQFCGKNVIAKLAIGKKETYEVNGVWDFPKGLLKYRVEK